ncbi:hypothetical protein JQX13_15845 [Archangium violaceum]|uniref:hypothetical protein n=1 Tax=Archangium violaceum TaxID=83451 RepID=UPI00193B07A3|nr:hypothetical protein [Archangium violaceum]QRK11410.1 hypothetical protein JQX13_15845 [Archangium violaceum]
MVHVYEKLQAVEFDRLPGRVQKAYLAPPVLSAPVAPLGEGFQLSLPTSLDLPAPRALVPKLGIKSWRDAGALGVIYEGVNIREVVERLLKCPTRPQRLAARAWLETGLPLRLHLSPYVDYSEVSEVRFLANPRECRRLSSCLRGQSAQSFAAALPQLTAFAEELATHLPQRSHLLEIAYLSPGEFWLVEVNPGLTPQDLAILER